MLITPRTVTRRIGLPATWIVLLGLGCAQPPHERLNAPPQGDTQRRARLQSDFAYMSDNAMLQDMALNDIHFVPNQPALSGAGEARLERFAELLADSGGTLNYLPPEDDPDLTKARVESARRFLADAYHGRSTIDVNVGMARGRPTDSDYAIEARHAGMAVFKPTGPSGGGGTGSGAAPGGGTNGGNTSGAKPSGSTAGGGGG